MKTNKNVGIRYKQQAGFTVVELLVVIVVIGILASLTIVGFTTVQNRAKESAAQSLLSQALKKVDLYAMHNSDQFPTSVTACPSPGTTELCINPSGGTMTYTVDNAAVSRAYCLDITTTGKSFYVDDASVSVLSGSCALRSCYSISQAGGSHGSGNYWIRPSGVSQSVRAYCDMDTSGGGWTLIVNNVGPATSWTTSSLRDLDAKNPSLTTNYSTLQYADDIKSNLSNRLNYRLDAQSLGRWGGVWDAPYGTSLEAISAQNVSTLIEKYDPSLWTQDTDPNDSNGTQTPSNVVPWVSSTYGLVTWGGTGNWWGAIATPSSGWSPAPWMSGPQQNPGVIRYWVR